MADQKIQITIEALDRAKGALSDLEKHLKGIEERSKTTGQEARNLGGIFSGLQKNWFALTVALNQGLEILNKILYIPRKMMAWGEMGAAVERTERAFRNVAQAAGVASEELIASLQRAARGTMDASDIMVRSSRMIQEGMDPSQIIRLMELLAKQAPVVGDTLAEAWDKFGVALATGNMRAIRAYVGLVDLEREYDKLASSLGVTKDRLTDTAKLKLALGLSIEKLTEKTKGLTAAHESYAETISKSKAEIKDSWEEIFKSAQSSADKFFKWYASVMKDLIGGGTQKEMAAPENNLFTMMQKWWSGKGLPAWIPPAYGASPALSPPEAEERRFIGRIPSRTKEKSPIAPRTPEQEREWQSFRLSTEARILELQGKEEEALKKKHAAELAGEVDAEKKAELKIRHVAELEKFNFDKRIYYTEAAAKLDADGWAKHEQILHDERAMREEMEEKDRAYYAWLDEIRGKPFERFQKRAGAAAEWLEGMPLAMEMSREKINQMTQLYKEMYDNLFSYGKDYASFRE